MPARVLKQRSAVKEAFWERIEEKKRRAREAHLRRIDETYPRWISFVVKPFADASFRREEKRNEDRGDEGEGWTALGLWFFLPKTWILMNDIVIQTGPEEFAQIDHIALGPGGIFLVETKNWQGALLVKGDDWLRKSGGGWKRVQSPTRQHRRHLELFWKWLRKNGFSLPWEAVRAVILIRGASWLEVENGTMPVFQGVFGLAWHIRRSMKNGPRLSQNLIQDIVQGLQEGRPFPSKPTAGSSASMPETRRS